MDIDRLLLHQKPVSVLFPFPQFFPELGLHFEVTELMQELGQAALLLYYRGLFWEGDLRSAKPASLPDGPISK